MRPDASEPPAWPATHTGRSLLLLWLVLGLGAWLVLAAAAFLVYWSLTALL